MNSMARRMFELVEPIGVIPYSADDPNETMFALGFTNYWDTYFAGRAAPLGRVPAERHGTEVAIVGVQLTVLPAGRNPEAARRSRRVNLARYGRAGVADPVHPGG